MKRSLRVLLAAAVILAALCSGAWAATQVTDNVTEWREAGSPYEVSSNVTISERVTVRGNVTLILNDNFTLNANLGITVSEGNAITITAPRGSKGTGTLMAKTYTNYWDAAIGSRQNEISGRRAPDNSQKSEITTADR